MQDPKRRLPNSHLLLSPVDFLTASLPTGSCGQHLAPVQRWLRDAPGHLRHQDFTLTATSLDRGRCVHPPSPARPGGPL